jgi:hypothetical protein
MLCIGPRPGEWIDLTDRRSGELVTSMKLYRAQGGDWRLAFDLPDDIKLDRRQVTRRSAHGSRQA